MKELSVGAKVAWLLAMGNAKEAKFQYVEKEHILIGICNLGKVSLEMLATITDLDPQALKAEYRTLKDVLKKFGIDLTQAGDAVQEKLHKGTCDYYEDEVVHRSDGCKKEVFARADELAMNAEVTNSIHLLAAILENPGNIISKVLEEAKVNLLDLQKKVIDTASNKKEIQEGIGNKKEPIIGKLEELIKVNNELINILKETIGKIVHPLNSSEVSLPKTGYREYIHVVISELKEIIAGLAEGLKFQAAMAVVEGIFVFYYSLGIWHFIIPDEKWNEISSINKGIVSFVLSVSVPLEVHNYIKREWCRFGVSLAVFITTVIYAFIVTFRRS